jgi:serine/threonine-protein kinase HipA
LKEGIPIDPQLPLYSGMQYSSSNGNFGIFKDASPDRWGQLLMKRREVLLSKIEKRASTTLSDIDFMLGVHDGHRMGGFRFKESENGPFLNDDNFMAAPPWTSLRELEYAVQKYEETPDRLTEDTLKWVNQLIAPGSSLGGARPKADVIDNAGNIWIAKFPSKNDDANVGLWEMVAHELAIQSKIATPICTVKKLASPYHTFLSQRFDRTNNQRRIHFASAMTLLQQQDGAGANQGISYLDIVSFIRSECSDVKHDLEELFRRVLLSVCISNTDDHLRNHGFIYTQTGWGLSPAFDINPNEYGAGLKLNIDEHDNSLDIDLVISTAPYYLLTKRRTDEIKNEVIHAVSRWRTIANTLGLPLSEIERKSEAFRVIEMEMKKR